MADKTKFDEHSDLDPFAELKRIIGLEPDGSSEPATTAQAAGDDFDLAEALAQADEPAAVSAAEQETAVAEIDAAHQPNDELADDFGIDLERELMGEFESVDTPLAEKAAAEIDEQEFDAVFAESTQSLDAAFADQPQSQDEIDADLEELNAVFAEAEPNAAVEAAPAVEPEPGAPVAAASEAEADEFVVALNESDFADIDDAIALELDEELSASLSATDVGADADLDVDAELASDLAQLDAAANEPVADAQAAAEPTALADVDMDFDSDLDWSGLDAPKEGAAAAAVTRPSIIDSADEFLAALDISASAPVADVEPASNVEPPVALAKMSDQYESRGSQYDWRQPARSAQQRAAAPEVETTEMFDQAFSMTDDLDLPEVRYEEPVQAKSDIDLEFDNLLVEMSRGEPARPVHTTLPEAPRYEPQQSVQRADAGLDDYDFDSVFAQPAPQATAAPVYREQVRDEQDFGDFNFDDDDFGDEEPVQQAYRPHSGGGRGGRGMMIAAIIGGVALLGGIGTWAMSWNGESGAPALVRADASPVKVRPENPGGTSVPNQDSPVYDTVSRSGSQPTVQERLVSTTEDPVALPLPDDSEAELLASATKDEDRVAANDVDDSAAQDPLAVAPRKVRTMIVKPDGSLVPAPVPAAAAPTEPSVEDIASARVEEPEQITTGATKPSAAEPETETVAAIPAPAAGGWAVQIASQPNEDDANKSLKRMGQKYSSVIGDRGLHIVKGEVPNKGTYWRVRVAANSRDDAVNVCSNIKSAGGSCFVTR